MEIADAPDRAGHARTAAPSTTPRIERAAARPGPPRKARAFWVKQLHTWHWISAALSLAGMLLFAVTGVTLNHAASIGAEPVVTRATAQLPQALLRTLPPAGAGTAPLPKDIADRVKAAVSLDPSGRAADWSSAEEVYVALPGPGRDAWVSIDRKSGDIEAEVTDRGWISYVNDLHKGRNAGTAWAWFIDAFAIACLVFTLTGLVLLQVHSRHRPLTWPMTALSLAIPVVLALFFIH